ncbi:primosomal protein N' [Bacillus horti]|uniref:Replication restart protein PriA n=1 Tax=Caldalkalibacillus horti TaxID=77523 RepID=A0ABT9VXH8_9BACI|nr:primosomal protein N' [Bacillus horti]MDQ0165697.1 primosomal protein N' (replication factor Y) [Bacillus horti]
MSDQPMLDQHKRVIAEVIVEVPARLVDRTFDYEVPPALEQGVQIGSRVIVPFGPRKTQGYVLGLKLQTEQSEQKLKEVEQVLDEVPPLSPELIQLGQWMSEEYTCLTIQALQAMLPAVLKSTTTKRTVTNDGKQQVVYEVEDKVTIKEVQVVELAVTQEELENKLSELHAKAVKQREVARYIASINFGGNTSQSLDEESAARDEVSSGASAEISIEDRSELSKASMPDNKRDRTELEKHREILQVQRVVEECQTTRSTIKALEQAGIVRISKQELQRDPYQHRVFERTQPLTLTEMQQSVLGKITTSVDEQEFRPFLLHGVTGSGKTEIYLQSISYVLKNDKEAIVLVPEISLTPQMVDRFKGRFGDQVAVLHSRLSKGERYDEWRKIRDGKVKVAIGARSALFAPFRNLGLIIIDEEHEASYKQEETPKYHARDIAMFRGQYHQAPVILGSATPCLESFARAKKGVYTLLSLQERIFGQELPPVSIVDMREELHAGNRTMFSKTLHELINQCLEKKEQMVLFLNRRGFSTFVMCRDCGYVLQCPHCDISLTYHKSNNSHRCHYCGYTQPKLHECPECASDHIRFFGTGTQKVEEELYKHFPGIRVVRMDVDTTQQKGAHEKLLKRFGDHQADVLLGTQMIAKGLDFEKVTLVGVIAADSLLHLPDFRSAEKTFQLLTQVSGRAGRHKLPGHVVVQTYTPEHYSIQTAAQHDYEAFFNHEMQHRKQRGYPPYYYLTLITFTHEDLPFLIKESDQAVRWLKQQVSPNTLVLGPAASAIPKIKDRYRFQCMLKYKDEPQLAHVLSGFLQKHKQLIEKSKLHIQIDRNPQMLM